MSDGIQVSQVKQKLGLAIFACTAFIVVGLGVIQFRAEKNQVASFWAQELTAVGTLKAAQISEWRKERLSDAIRFAQGPTLTRAIEKGDPSDIRIMLSLNRKAEFYWDALLVSPDGVIHYSVREDPKPLTEAARQAVGRAVSTHQSAFSDFYLGQDEAVFIDIAAPVKSPDNKTVAAFVLRCSASNSVYRLIESWPGTSSSAETLLARREGDMAVSLTMVRHQRDSALKLKRPLDQKECPLVQAVRGAVGVISGIDYRSVEVLADVRPIPDSDWFIITKVDKREILADIKTRAAIIGGFVALAILLIASMTAFLSRHRQAALYRNLYRAEQEQRLSTEKFKTILYSIGDAVITTDDHGCVQQMNPIAERLTGWTEGEACGHALEDVFRIIGEETREPEPNPVWSVLRDGTITGMKNHTILLSRQGQEYPISDSGAPIRDGQGNISGVVLVFRDQTAERAAQRALYLSERRLSTLMENLPGIVYRCHMDTYWTMAFISSGCKALTGYDVSDLLDNKTVAYFDLIHPEDRQAVWDTVDAAVRKREAFTIEYRIRTKDGSEKWVWERGCAIHAEDGSVEALEGFIHDITERKEAALEQAKLNEQIHQAQKIEAIGRLAGGVAHDFNNMLSVIIGNIELANDHVPAGTPLRTLMDAVLNAAKHSADLVKQLLGFASKQVISPRRLNLNDAISGMRDMLGRLLGNAVSLEWVPGAAIWPVLMDPNQIDQILVSLTVNARDKMSGVRKITIKTSNVSQYKVCTGSPDGTSFGDYVQLSFSDDGGGMDAQTQANIFEPFYSTKTHEGGGGIGLAMVYGIVKQNNGFIRVISQPGKGSSFHIFLPRLRSLNEPTRELPDGASRDGAPSEQPETGAKTILLVEDEATVLALTTNLLSKMGYAVIPAMGPNEAIRRSRETQGPIHLLLTDVVMPERSGLDLWKALCQERPEMKCLYMSGYTSNILEQHGLNVSEINFIQKPFTRAALSDKVRETLNR